MTSFTEFMVGGTSKQPHILITMSLREASTDKRISQQKSEKVQKKSEKKSYGALVFFSQRTLGLLKG